MMGDLMEELVIEFKSPHRHAPLVWYGDDRKGAEEDILLSHESYRKKWPPTMSKCPKCEYATIYPVTLERHRERKGH